MGIPSVLVADDVGFLKRIGGLPENPEVVSRWGDAGSGRGVVKCTSAVMLPEQQQIYAVARETGLVELWECERETPTLTFKLREGTDSSTGASAPGHRTQTSCAALAWSNQAGCSDLPPLISVSRDGLVCIRRVTAGSSNASPTSSLEDTSAEGDVGKLPLTQTLAASFEVLPRSDAGAESGDHISHAQELKVYVESADVAHSGASLAVGGKGLEVCTWDMEQAKCTWRARNPKPDALGLVEEKWVTSLCHVSSSSPGLIAAGTGAGTVHLFDTAAQRRPVATWKAGASPVTCLLPAGAHVSDGSAVIFGTRDGALGIADIRKGQLIGKFKGGAGGALKAAAVHPSLPILASCGLDRYVRFHDLRSRELKGQVFLKQPGTGVLFFEGKQSDRSHGAEEQGDAEEEDKRITEKTEDPRESVKERVKDRRNGRQVDQTRRKKRRS